MAASQRQRQSRPKSTADEEHRPKWTQAMDLAAKEEVRKAAEDPRVVFLDVRSHAELAEAALKRSYLHAPCMITLCENLETKRTELLPEKDAPIIVFCRSGRRATKAKEVLEGKGYTNVMNAGGLTDLDHLFE